MDNYLEARCVFDTYDEAINRQPGNPFLARMPDLHYACVDTFELESGVSLKNVPVSFMAIGELNMSGDNAIVVCHPLIGHPDFRIWWNPLIGEDGHTFNVKEYFIICLTMLGSAYGSAGPLTVRNGDPESGLYGPEFPLTTVRDDVKIHRIVIDALGVKQVAAVIGPSIGGMHALEWSYYGLNFVRSVVTISTSSKHSPYFVSWSEVTRQMIFMDPKFERGFYSVENPPVKGLALSFMLVILQGRTPASFDSWGRSGCRGSNLFMTETEDSAWYHNNEGHGWLVDATKTDSLTTPKGGRTQQSTKNTVGRNKKTEPQVMLEDFIRRFAERFSREFDANCMVSLLRKLDTHDISRNRVSSSVRDPLKRIKIALGMIQQPALVVGVPGDMLFPYAEQLEQADGIPNCRLVTVETKAGHEMFLQEAKALNRIVYKFLSEIPGDVSTSNSGIEGIISKL